MPAAHSPRADRLAIAITGFALLALAVVATAREVSPAWRVEQDRVHAYVEKRVGPEAAAKLPAGLQQIWIPEIDRVDRCVTCHAAVEAGPEVADAPNPARSHPHPKLLAQHPIEKFGCTLCHGGQGWATTEEAAHGQVEFWDEPLITADLARWYGLTRAEMMEVRCNACHRHDPSVEGMPLLNAAKVASKACAECHVLNGVREDWMDYKGPDLTAIGDRAPEQLHFPEGWSKPRTALRWHVEHLRAPAEVVPGSKMKAFLFDDRRLVGLGLMVLSWRTVDLPPAWIPRRR